MRQTNPHAGWRHFLKANEAQQVSQIEAEIERAIRTIVEPLKAERQRFATRAHMRMIRAKRTPAGGSATSAA